MTPVKRAAVLKDLDGDYGQREGFACVAGKDRQNPDPKHFEQRFFQWPQQRSAAASYVRDLVQSGWCVWKPTSLCVGESRTHTAASNIVSFEVDQELSDKAWQLLRSVDAAMVSSGTDQHFHVKVTLDRDLAHGELAQLTRHLASACGITGHSDSGGKWKPNDLLRVVGTFNTKHDPPVEVALMHDGKGTTVEDLRAILTTYDAPARVIAGSADIEPEAIAWDAVPGSVRHQYDEIPLYIDARSGQHDASGGCWQFWMKCKRRHLSIGQAYYMSTQLDPDGYIADKYSPRSVEAQIRKVYGTEPPKSKSQSTPSGNEGGIKGTGGMTVNSDNNPDDPVFGNHNLGVLNLRELRTNPPPPPTFLEQGFIERGAVTKITAESGAGKSILLADLAWHWAVEGRSALTDYTIEGGALTVLYVDGELGQRWWLKYLAKFGVPLDAPRLIVKCFPDWPSLTTDAGAAMFWELFEHFQPNVVVFDTLSTFVEGDENSSETFAAFDRRVTLPLISREVTVLIADHAGKDVTRDARGSSAKRAKMDAEWMLTAAKANRDDLHLSIRKDRHAVLDQDLLLTRRDDPLRHEPSDPLTATVDFTGERKAGRPKKHRDGIITPMRQFLRDNPDATKSQAVRHVGGTASKAREAYMLLTGDTSGTPDDVLEALLEEDI